eukprot:768284-Hanusia_phi.AAC.1
MKIPPHAATSSLLLALTDRFHSNAHACFCTSSDPSCAPIPATTASIPPPSATFILLPSCFDVKFLSAPYPAACTFSSSR